VIRPSRLEDSPLLVETATILHLVLPGKKSLEVVRNICMRITLLDVLRNAGFDIPSSCEVGNCGACRIGVQNGRIEHRGMGLL
jgi:ferredoxin